MSVGASLRDGAQIARFHVVKALRTRTLVLLCAVYAVAATGISWIFRRILHELEKNLATVLLVPPTETPGAMIDALKKQQEFTDFVRGLLPDEALLSWAVEQPLLPLAYFWMAIGLLPFLAAAAGAEVLSDGIRDRSLRYELVRTGRIELVLGRFVGQAALVTLATVGSLVGPFAVAVFFMANQPAGQQATALLLASPKLVAWSLPFLGLGVGTSALTGSANGARTLALGAVVGTWTVAGLLETRWVERNAAWLADALEPLLPQTYLLDLWGPVWGWAGSGAILLGLGVAFALASFPLFRRRKI